MPFWFKYTLYAIGVILLVAIIVKIINPRNEWPSIGNVADSDTTAKILVKGDVILKISRKDFQDYKKFDEEVTEIQEPAEESFAQTGKLSGKILQGLANKSMTEREIQEVISNFKLISLVCNKCVSKLEQIQPKNSLPQNVQNQLNKYKLALIETWQLRSKGCNEMKPEYFTDAQKKYSEAVFKVYENYKVIEQRNP